MPQSNTHVLVRLIHWFLEIKGNTVCNLGKGKVQDFLTEKYSFLLNGARVFMQEKQNAHSTQVAPLGFFSLFFVVLGLIHYFFESQKNSVKY